jgi:hypothetical protein
MYEMVSDSFKELNSFITKGHDLRICILDNNNVHFCTQHEKYFPVDKIYGYYDLILVPGWVYAKVNIGVNIFLLSLNSCFIWMKKRITSFWKIITT